MSVGYNLGTLAFGRYGQDEKRIKRYAKNVPIIYHITVWNKRVNEYTVEGKFVRTWKLSRKIAEYINACELDDLKKFWV